MVSRYMRQHLTHRFSPGSKLFFGTDVGWLTFWVVSYDPCDIEHAAPGSVLCASNSSNASSGLPGPPAGGRGKDGRIITISSRHSTAAQREVGSLCLYICCHPFLYISVLCWHVGSCSCCCLLLCWSPKTMKQRDRRDLSHGIYQCPQ